MTMGHRMIIRWLRSLFSKPSKDPVADAYRDALLWRIEQHKQFEREFSRITTGNKRRGH